MGKKEEDVCRKSLANRSVVRTRELVVNYETGLSVDCWPVLCNFLMNILLVVSKGTWTMHPIHF